MCKLIPASVLNMKKSELFRKYLEFWYSELGDSSWNRTLNNLALKEYKDPVPNIEKRHWKINTSICPSVKSVNRLVGMKMP